MALHACPACGASLLFRPLTPVRSSFHSVRWYQFAPTPGLCPSCGVTLVSHPAARKAVCVVFFYWIFYVAVQHLVYDYFGVTDRSGKVMVDIAVLLLGAVPCTWLMVRRG